MLTYKNLNFNVSNFVPFKRKIIGKKSDRKFIWIKRKTGEFWFVFFV